jgi:hypothetical protein
MPTRIQTTERGFIVEGEIAPAPSSPTAHGREPDERPLHHALIEGLSRLRGERVRITVEVLRRSPTDRLRDLIERFREESEEPPSRNFSNLG